MKKLALMFIGVIAIASCKKESTAPAGTKLEIVITKVVSPTVYTLKITKGTTTALDISGATENKTYTIPVSPGDGYTVTYSFTSGGKNADGGISFNYNGENRGAVGAYGSGTTTVTIPK
jgi:hypothetical protein